MPIDPMILLPKIGKEPGVLPPPPK